MQEQADEKRDVSLLHADAKVGSVALGNAVKVEHAADAADVEAMNCRRQLSWLQFGATAVGIEDAASFLYSSKTTSDPIPGQTITSSCKIDRSRDIDPSWATLCL